MLFLFSLVCRIIDAGTSYLGEVNRTKTGKLCQRWDSQTPHPHNLTKNTFFPDLTIKDASSFCRNPAGLRDNLWCYTSNSSVEWEYCDVPLCGKIIDIQCVFGSTSLGCIHMFRARYLTTISTVA